MAHIPHRCNTLLSSRQQPGVATYNSLYTLLCSLVFFSTIVTCQDTNFTFSKFDAGSLTLVADSRIINATIRLVNMSVNSNQSTTVGRALYPNQVQLRNSATKASASFQASFTFSIDTKPGNWPTSQPSGIAWGFFPDNRTIGDTGRFLGRLNASTDNFLSNRVFAIEVDTSFSTFSRLGFQDVSSCHLGVDLQTMNSQPVFDMAVPKGSETSLCVQNKGVYTLHMRYDCVSHGLLVHEKAFQGSEHLRPRSHGRWPSVVHVQGALHSHEEFQRHRAFRSRRFRKRVPRRTRRGGGSSESDSSREVTGDGGEGVSSRGIHHQPNPPQEFGAIARMVQQERNALSCLRVSLKWKPRLSAAKRKGNNRQDTPPLEYTIQHLDGSSLGVGPPSRGDWPMRPPPRTQTWKCLVRRQFQRMLADFGLARLTDHDQGAATTMLAGTMGYIAPELPHTGRATTQTDVYSFGILVLEILCGRRPTDINIATQLCLLDCVRAAYAGNDILAMADSKIRNHTDRHTDRHTARYVEVDVDKDRVVDKDVDVDLNLDLDLDAPQIERMMLLGLLCCHPNPVCRPSMRNVRQMLMGDNSLLRIIPVEKPVGGYLQYGPYYLELELLDDEEVSMTMSSSKANGRSRYTRVTEDSFLVQSKSFVRLQ